MEEEEKVKPRKHPGRPFAPALSFGQEGYDSHRGIPFVGIRADTLNLNSTNIRCENTFLIPKYTIAQYSAYLQFDLRIEQMRLELQYLSPVIVKTFKKRADLIFHIPNPQSTHWNRYKQEIESTRDQDGAPFLMTEPTLPLLFDIDFAYEIERIMTNFGMTRFYAHDNGADFEDPETEEKINKFTCMVDMFGVEGWVHSWEKQYEFEVLEWNWLPVGKLKFLGNEVKTRRELMDKYAEYFNNALNEEFRKKTFQCNQRVDNMHTHALSSPPTSFDPRTPS